jgi:putative SOS response-associated peptidase YedK
MCGRFTLHHSTEDIAERFGIEQVLMDLVPRYNIAPSQPVSAIVQRESRTLEQFKWGLVPSWAQDPAVGNRMINARSESASEKPAFRDAFRRHRCLIPASGYYEWKRIRERSLPQYIYRADENPFIMAGLWEEWNAPGGAVVRTCAVLTTEPNPFAAAVHNRMPAILTGEECERWLDPRSDVVALQGLLHPHPDDDLAAHEVGMGVNKAGFDDPTCVLPCPPELCGGNQLELPLG